MVDLSKFASNKKILSITNFVAKFYKKKKKKKKKKRRKIYVFFLLLYPHEFESNEFKIFDKKINSLTWKVKV